MNAPTAIVVSYNTRERLRACLSSLECPEIIVVDNGSSDGSAEMVRTDFPRVSLLANRENSGFGRACNQALAAAKTAYVLLVNSDAELLPGALVSLVATLESEPTLAVVGPRILGPLGPEASFGERPGLLADYRHARLVRGSRSVGAPGPRGPAWVSAACWLARREALLSVGGFDESFFLYYEDVDLCLRLRAAGFGIAFDPSAQILHARGESTPHFPGARLEAYRSHLRLYRKHVSRNSTGILRGIYVARGLALLSFAKTRDLARALLALGIRGA